MMMIMMFMMRMVIMYLDMPSFTGRRHHHDDVYDDDGDGDNVCGNGAEYEDE